MYSYVTFYVADTITFQTLCIDIYFSIERFHRQRSKMYFAYIDISDTPLPPTSSCYLDDKLKIHFKLRYKFICDNHTTIVATANLLFPNVDKFPSCFEISFMIFKQRKKGCTVSTIYHRISFLQRLSRDSACNRVSNGPGTLISVLDCG